MYNVLVNNKPVAQHVGTTAAITAVRKSLGDYSRGCSGAVARQAATAVFQCRRGFALEIGHVRVFRVA